MKNKIYAVALIFGLAAMLATVPSMAQQITGVPGSPSATTTLGGKQLPPPDPKFGGVIKGLGVESMVGATRRAAQGGAVGLAALIATHNPVGLIVGTGVKVYGEERGSSKVEGRAKATAKEIADVLKGRFQEQGWIN